MTDSKPPFKNNVRDARGKYAKGNPGNPNAPGRPKGSRHRLTEKFLKTFADSFEKHGEKVIEEVRKEDPTMYLRIAASLLPKTIEHEGEVNSKVAIQVVRNSEGLHVNEVSDEAVSEAPMGLPN